MIRVQVQTHLQHRTVNEMSEMVRWVIDNFPNDLDENRWKYGSDIYRPYDHKRLLNGPWEIEYFDFRDEADATWFKMRWM